MFLVRVAQHGLAVGSVILRAGRGAGQMGQLSLGKVCEVLTLKLPRRSVLVSFCEQVVMRPDIFLTEWSAFRPFLGR